jgi:hypothetical protein
MYWSLDVSVLDFDFTQAKTLGFAEDFESTPQQTPFKVALVQGFQHGVLFGFVHPIGDLDFDQEVG